MSERQSAAPPQFAERYQVEGELGRGATAIVYLARDRDLGRLVAIKVLRVELRGSISNDRFFREIQLTADLSHPHIVPVLASGQHDAVPYCVMPYMDEGTLRQRLQKERQLPLEDVVSIGACLARALGFAHSRNFIHRDVKPENILFTGGQPVLADFGIARALERSMTDSTTSTGIVRGTPAYMSPEQASAEHQLDGRSDLYSLACVLYEAAAGVPAFVGATAQAIASQRMFHLPRPLHVYRPTVPAQLETVLLKAFAVSPADRFRTAEDFATALEAVDLSQPSGGATAVRSEWPTTEVRRFIASRRRAMTFAALALVTVIIAVVVLLHRPAATLGDVREGDPRRIAVLYLDNLTPDVLPSHISDGMTEALIDQLSAVRALRVVSPAAVRRFRGQAIPPDSIARALRVGTIVTGSIAQEGSIMRLTVSMTDSGGRHYPVHQIDAARVNLFPMQDSLAEQVSYFLRRSLGELIDVHTYSAATRSAQALELAQLGSDAMLRTLFLSNDRVGPLYFLADSMFSRAAAADPDWALPLLKRGTLAILVGQMSPAPPGPPPSPDSVALASATTAEQRFAWMRRAHAFADDALRRDARSPEALWVRGESYFAQVKRNAPGADSLARLATTDFRASLAARPDYARAWSSLAQLSQRAGRWAESADEFQAAYDLDTFLQVREITPLAFTAALFAGRFDDAKRWCRLGLERKPALPEISACELVQLGWVGRTRADAASAQRLLGRLERSDSLHMFAASWSYWRLMVAAVEARAGMTDSARTLLAKIKAHDESPATRRRQSLPDAYVRLLLGDRAEAIAILSAWQRDARNPTLGVHPWFTALHGDTAFDTLLIPAR